jgi:integrase
MAQLERPDNLNRWNIPAYQLVTVILMRCGLRVTDALGLPGDCIVRDANGAPYLRYYNHKMRREALVPVDEELERAIGEHRRRLRTRWPQGTPRLFPKLRDNPAGSGPSVTAPTAMRCTAGWNAATSATSTVSPST